MIINPVSNVLTTILTDWQKLEMREIKGKGKGQDNLSSLLCIMICANSWILLSTAQNRQKIHISIKRVQSADCRTGI